MPTSSVSLPACSPLLRKSSTARAGKVPVCPSSAASWSSPTVSGIAPPVLCAVMTSAPISSALATPLLSNSGVNGLGIWSTTLGNSA